jgi:hypothetical protein
MKKDLDAGSLGLYRYQMLAMRSGANFESKEAEEFVVVPDVIVRAIEL